MYHVPNIDQTNAKSTMIECTMKDSRLFLRPNKPISFIRTEEIVRGSTQ